MKHLVKNSLLALPLIGASLFSQAEDVVGSQVVNIETIGCHLNDNTCYIHVDTAVGVEGQCKDNSIRWKSDAANGQEILSMFLAAKIANKSVRVYVTDTCFDGGSYPTFNFMVVN